MVNKLKTQGHRLEPLWDVLLATGFVGDPLQDQPKADIEHALIARPAL